MHGESHPVPAELIRDWDESYRHALTRAALASERARMALVAGLVGVLLAIFIVIIAVPEIIPALYREKFIGLAPVICGLYTGFIIYELAARAAVGRWLRLGVGRPAWLPYLNAAIEAGLPTVLILAASHVLTPLEALSIPPVFAYPVLIMLLALQLKPMVCMFAGAVATLQFVGAGLYVLGQHHANTGSGFGLASLPSRAGMILFAGVAAAFLAWQLRRQFVSSTRAVAQREHAIGVFGQHVTPQVAERLLSQRVETGPETREVCVMFLDIRNFTAFAERRTPEEVMSYLNRVFGPMIETVNRHGGIINKFLGDGFMAVFGAPMEDGQAARHAVAASMELVEHVKDVRDATADDPVDAGGGVGVPATRIGIGLHAGPAVTGNLGSAGRKEYTVIGAVVNLASRIEQLNKQYDSQVLASETVVAALAAGEGNSAEKLGEVPVRGQAVPVTLFRLA